MGLLKKLFNIGREQVDKADKALEDPARDGKYAIEDAQKQINGFKQDIANLVANNKGLERKEAALKDEVKKYGKMAEGFIEGGDDEKARQCLESQNNKEVELKGISSQVKQNNALISKLRGDVNRAQAKIERSKSDLTSLKARQESAKIRKSLSQARTSLGENDPLAELDKFRNSVDEMECEAEAYEDMAANENTAESLEEAYNNLGTDSEVDDKLAKLKEKMAAKS